MPPSPLVHTLRVRYGECDPQGIVFNAHYFAYFDIALTELWRVALPGGYVRMQEAGLDMVVAEATCRFRIPARFDDLLDVAVTIARLGTTSMITAMTIDRVDERVPATSAAGAGVGPDGSGRALVRVAEGEMRHVFVEVPAGTKTAIPDWVRDALAPWSAESATVA